jgi:hypothetical protein
LESVREGFGVEHFQNDDVYEGQYQSSNRTGIGRYLYSSSNFSYVGEFLNGQRQGFGNLKGAQLSYIGEFRDNMRHGIGYQTLGTKRAYFGQFKDDVRSGIGIEISYTDDIEYRGEWMNDKPNGLGLIRTEGRSQAAYFANGEMADPVDETSNSRLKKIIETFESLNLSNFLSTTEEKIRQYGYFIEERRVKLVNEFREVEQNWKVNEMEAAIDKKLESVFEKLEEVYFEI